MLRAAAAQDLAVVAARRRHQARLGHCRPRRLDVLVDTGRLDRVVEHAAGDLIVDRAGRRAAGRAAATRSAGAGQRLAVDEAVPGATRRRDARHQRQRAAADAGRHGARPAASA